MREKSLLERLSEYGNSDYYPFHMPGHKRQDIDDTEGEGFPDPYSIDITEIDGFDNLHHAEGILRKSMDWAADLYGADQTYYLVNGSTCGILSAVCGTTSSGGTILIARNCHKSAYNGLILNRLNPVYVRPQLFEEFGLLGSVRPEAVEARLREDRERTIQSVLLVSPTYEGIVSDIEKIAEIVHEYKIPLIVDEAHGAHFPFAESGLGFPASALSLGADVVIQSLHKTLPSFTQTAVLHVRGGLADREKLERYLGMFQSSSPSYIFMAGIERCIRFMDSAGRKEMAAYRERLDRFFSEAENLKVLKVLNSSVKGKEAVFDWDPSKLVISTKWAAGFDGERLGQTLRTQYHLEMEMCAPEHVVAMTSLMDTEDGLKRLSAALREIDGRLEFSENTGGLLREYRESEEISLIPARAAECQKERIGLQKAAGRVCAEFVYIYPPGIPILVPGERITKKAVQCILEYRAAGLPVQGPSDHSLASILTVAEKENRVV